MRIKENLKRSSFLLLTLVMFFGLINIALADSPWTWQKTYGGIYSERAHWVEQTSDNGFILTGWTKSFGDGSAEVWLVKTDALGNEEWNRTFGGSDFDVGYSVKQTSDGGYILTGYTASYAVGDAAIWLIKTNASGYKIWDKVFRGQYSDFGEDVLQCDDGGYIVLCEISYLKSNVEKDKSKGIVTDIMLLKTDSGGNELWSKTYGSPELDYCDEVKKTPDGGYIIVGSSQTFETPACYDVCLIKTDSEGNEEWLKLYGEDGKHEFGYSVDLTNDGGYIVTGSSEITGWRISLLKVNAFGDLEWNLNYGKEIGSAVQQTLDNGYIIVGRGERQNGSGKDDFLLIKTDLYGNEEWTETFGGSNAEWAYSGGQNSQGHYYMAGWTKSFGAGQDDFWLVYFDPNAIFVAIEEEEVNLSFPGGSDCYPVEYDLEVTVRNCEDILWSSSDPSIVDVDFLGHITAKKTGTATITASCSLDPSYHDECQVKVYECPTHQFQKTYGGSGDEVGFCVKNTPPCGCILTGYTKSYGAGNADIWLIKVDSQGREEWSRTFGGSGADYGYCVINTPDNGYLITGEMLKFPNQMQNVVIKTDAQGNQKWLKDYGSSKNDGGRSVIHTQYGNYVIVGYNFSYGAGGSDLWLIKIDNNGNILWDKTFGGINDDYGSSIALTLESDFLITGWTESYGVNNRDLLLVKANSQGIEEWVKTFDFINDDAGYCIKATIEGGFIIAGACNLNRSEDASGLVLKIDADGNEEWHKIIDLSGLSGNNEIRSIVQDSDGSFFATGYLTAAGSEFRNLYLFKMDSIGNIVWDWTFGGSKNDEGYSIDLAGDNCIILTGYTESYSINNSKDLWLLYIAPFPATNNSLNVLIIFTSITLLVLTFSIYIKRKISTR